MNTMMITNSHTSVVTILNLFFLKAVYPKKSVSPFLMTASRASSIGVSPPAISIANPAASSLSTRRARASATSSLW
jgi:hypothetical protein